MKPATSMIRHRTNAERMTKSRRFYRDVDGILLLDKAFGVSSNAALQQVRELFGAKKAGHAGSLDPLATGLLPVCFGHATKVCGRLLNAGKRYRVGVQLGARTESLDCETEVVERAPIPALTADSVDRVLASFLGEQQQLPPMHSALKHAGQRLYELARRGESVERATRQITISAITRLDLQPERLDFEVSCSKGTYIRSLAADVAAKLGTLGYVAALRRIGVEPFDNMRIYTVDELRERRQDAPPEVLDPVLLGADVAFADLGSATLTNASEGALIKGQAVHATERAPVLPLRAYAADGRFLGLVQGQPDGRVRPVRLFVGSTPP
jgi:tRNA pseudouridine55 synthase